MKHFIYSITILLFAAMAIQAQTQKIGYVNSEIILQQLPEAIRAQGQLDAQIETWYAQLDSMRTKLQTEYEAFQKQAQTMSEEAALAQQQQLAQQQLAMEQFQQQKFAQGQGEVFRLQEKLLAPVKEKIFAVIDEIAKEEGMNFVFDKPGDILLLYADPEFDITYRVLDRLTKKKN